MKEKLKILRNLLQGDSNPKWTALLDLLTEIVDNLDKGTSEKSEDNKETDDKFEDLFKRFNDKVDQMIEGIPDKLDGIFKRFKSKNFNVWK